MDYKAILSSLEIFKKDLDLCIYMVKDLRRYEGKELTLNIGEETYRGYLEVDRFKVQAWDLAEHNHFHYFLRTPYSRIRISKRGKNRVAFGDLGLVQRVSGEAVN